MTLDRLDSVVIGNRCEVDGCECVAVAKQDRCYDHSVDRLIEILFVNEKCKFGGVNCEGNASRVNEHDVLMCDACHNVYQRIQRGRGAFARFLPTMFMEPQVVRQNPPGTTYDGGSYHRNINWEALIESAREEGEETE